MNNNKVYILLLNWNGYHDTIECLKSIYESYLELNIVLVDNNSDDDSVEKIVDYLNNSGINHETFTEEDIKKLENKNSDPSNARFAFILNNKNHGFAGGNNVGLRYILLCKDVKYAWMLNTDCVIDSNTLPELVKEAEKNTKTGFVGSISRYYENRNIIQCYGGGIHYPLLGVSKLYMKNKNINDINLTNKPPIDYIMGVSLFVRLDVIKDIGLLVEDYFLYSEEVDWQYTAKKKGWEISVAGQSYVFHKDSASTKTRKHMFYYYINRASIMFNKKFYGIGIAMLSSLSLMIISILRAWPNAKSIIFALRGIKDGLVWRWKK